MMNWIWLGAVVAFGVLEAATAALVSIWFVGGAAVALLASFLGAALWLQIALFLAVSVGILAAVRPLIKRANAKTVPTNVDRVIGCTARVTEEIDNEAGTGRVCGRGQDLDRPQQRRHGAAHRDPRDRGEDGGRQALCEAGAGKLHAGRADRLTE